ncbi:response regulator [Natrarchaeobius oligotrophus]|uniref:Response regulator n=1 Tax=Natrarchaeobius chitinivorans TaxID=1679083 RepID=A0A3N6MD24_NATCH|nr:response regulator [Natrarchaeobius chitinivorans]RQG98654.1 response regulator [Natrarchaeobius chitinivorans]
MSEPVEEPIEILLVEDNPGDVRLTREAFKELSVDVELCVATDGKEALDLLSERRDVRPASVPDLVLLDLNLPRMDGFEFLRKIEEMPPFGQLPVLILTSSTASEDVLESYDLAANAYLTKPTGPDEYTSMVRSVVNFWFEHATLPSIAT